MLWPQHGIRVLCTRDADFLQFPRVESVDPMLAEP